MSYIKELYFHIKGEPDENAIKMGTTCCNYLKASLSYDLGGYNMFSHKPKPRGYYMCISPIGYGKDAAGHWESTSLSGKFWSDCIVQVSRQSKKKEQEAIEFFDSNLFSIIKEQFPEIEIEIE